MADSINDLTIKIENTNLNLRVAILVNTPSGFIFEKSKEGYFYAIGGRIKLHETSKQAAHRELFEELMLKDVNLRLTSIIKNFFKINTETDCQEVNFVFKADLEHSPDLTKLFSDNGNAGYHFIKPTDFDLYDIRPKMILEAARNDELFSHLINEKPNLFSIVKINRF